MKIAVFHNLPSGGAKRALYELTKRLCRDHQVDLFRFDVTDESFLDLRDLVNSEHIFTLRKPFFVSLCPDWRFPKILLVPAFKKASIAMARSIELRGYDVAFVNLCEKINSPYLLRYLQQVPTVFYCQEPYRALEPYRNTGRGIREKILRLMRRCYAWIDSDNARYATRILTPSCFCRELIYRTYGIFSHVSQLGVDTEQFSLKMIVKRRCILSVGSLDLHKAHDFIIRSAAIIEPKPEVWLVYNWSAPGRETYLRTLAEKLGVTLRLSGSISEEELVEAYNTASVTACASIMELLGLAALESMSCGTPVVAVREAGYRETVIDGQTGYLVDRDIEDFAQALARVLDNPDLRNQMGIAGRQHMKNTWTWEHANSALEANMYRVVKK
jgi:glycosyltransferase involved in cell wall biosynthesis